MTPKKKEVLPPPACHGPQDNQEQWRGGGLVVPLPVDHVDSRGCDDWDDGESGFFGDN